MVGVPFNGSDAGQSTPKFNSSPLKNSDWKMNLSFWGAVTFQGRAVKLEVGCYIFYIFLESINFGAQFDTQHLESAVCENFELSF